MEYSWSARPLKSVFFTGSYYLHFWVGYYSWLLAMRAFKLDFIGIGANKAGTSWLNQMLDVHPQICMSEPKEAHFFHDISTFSRPAHIGNFKKGPDWYKRFFKHCKDDLLKGEITPKYLIDPVVPGRIKSMFPECKIILCMRSPVDRAVSQYYFEKYFNHREKRPVSIALRSEPEYVMNGLYHKGIERYLTYFPFSSIMLIWFDDIKSQPEKVIRDVYTFLGVDASFVPTGLHEKFNAAKRSRSKWVRDMITVFQRKMTDMGMSGIVRGMKKIGLHKLVARLNARPISYQGISDDDRTWLLEQFREDTQKLQAMTGRDLSAWLK
jgi:hypothetical protein